MDGVGASSAAQPPLKIYGDAKSLNDPEFGSFSVKRNDKDVTIPRPIHPLNCPPVSICSDPTAQVEVDRQSNARRQAGVDEPCPAPSRQSPHRLPPLLQLPSERIRLRHYSAHHRLTPTGPGASLSFTYRRHPAHMGAPSITRLLSRLATDATSPRPRRTRRSPPYSSLTGGPRRILAVARRRSAARSGPSGFLVVPHVRKCRHLSLRAY